MSQNRERRRKARQMKRGQAPGTATYAGPARDAAIAVRVTHYDAERVQYFDSFDADVVAHAQSPSSVTWIDVDGIHDAEIVQAITGPFEVHALWVEELLNPGSRPKAEALGARLLTIVRMVRVVDRELEVEQVGLVCGPDWVLSFQERPGDVWDAVRARIASGARIRRMGSAYLLHALLDAVVDEYFSAIELLDTRVDALETLAIRDAPPDLAQQVYALRGEIVAFRHSTRPFREAVSQFTRREAELIDDATLPFYADLYDHVLQVMELTENARERLAGVLELHLALTSHHLNIVMRVLTVVSTVFIPLTFIVGVYGMNFAYMPELQWRGAYFAVLALMAAIGVGLVAMFKRLGWLG